MLASFTLSSAADLAAPAVTFWPLAGALPSSAVVDGNGEQARFSRPQAVAVDASGNVYVADRYLRRISPNGDVTTIETPDLDFNAVAVDRNGNIFGATSRRIIKVDANGQASVFAGNGAQARVDGPAASASFMYACGLAVDADGSVYVGEGKTGFGRLTVLGNCIRRITSDGQVSTLAGGGGPYGSVDGLGAEARFSDLRALALGPDGNLYVADAGNNAIRRVTKAGLVSTVIRENGIDQPSGIAVRPDGALLVSNTGRFTVVRISGDSAPVVVAGADGQAGNTSGAAENARFNSPAGLALDAAGTLWIAEPRSFVVRKLDGAGRVSTVAGRPDPAGHSDGWATRASFDTPRGAAFGGGVLFVADSGNHCIRRVTTAGVVSTYAGVPGVAGGNDGPRLSAQFSWPEALCVGADGAVYVAEPGRVRRISADGAVSTLAGAGTVDPPFPDGVGTQARFSYLTGIAADGNGNVYVSDCQSFTVRKITPEGVVTTYAGVPGQAGANDGPRLSARFEEPSGLLFEPTGDLLVADPRNHAIRRIRSTGEVTTLTSRFLSPADRDNWEPGSLAFSADGGLWMLSGSSLWKRESDGFTWWNSTAGLYSFSGDLAVDSAGRLYVFSILHRLYVGAVDARPSRLMNVSCRATTESGDRVLIAGFIFNGAETPVLVRGIGPGLARYGVSGAASVTETTLFSNTTPLASNRGWSGGSDLAEIEKAAAGAGAFALGRGSADSALLRTLSEGAYTVHVAGSGVALAEVYGLLGADTSAQLVNVSGRCFVGTGENVLIAGFILAGDSPRRVLIRAAGPALKDFGVSGVLERPRLRLFSDTTVIAEDQGWSSTYAAAELAGAFSESGSFPFAAGANDAAIVVTLQPGAYTAQVSGVGDTTGVALVEVYALPE